MNLLSVVARANVDRIYGDLRFDYIDADFTEAVVSVAAGLPGRGYASVPVVRSLAPVKNVRRDNPPSKIASLAARLRGEA